MPRSLPFKKIRHLELLPVKYAIFVGSMQNNTCKTVLSMIIWHWWRCILVKARRFEEGPKNPLKGISMKSLVLAFFAQIRVGAGG